LSYPIALISPGNSVACTMLMGRTSSVNFLISGSFAHVQIRTRNELPTAKDGGIGSFPLQQRKGILHDTIIRVSLAGLVFSQ
jgi:hypothetical protein